MTIKNGKNISTRLKIAKNRIYKNLKNTNQIEGSSIGSALKMSTELVVTVVVGSTIGFILDGWFDTKPWLTITFFFIGVIAGILNVFKTAKRMQKK